MRIVICCLVVCFCLLFDCLNFAFGFQFADCFLSMAKKKVSARAESRQAEEALYVFANFKASKMLVHLETNIIKDTSMLFFCGLFISKLNINVLAIQWGITFPRNSFCET